MDNLLRKINDMSDFTFIHEGSVDKYRLINGPTAESPARMFKYLFRGTIYTVSDNEVTERSGYDMLFK